MLAKGAVIFIAPIIARRTIPGAFDGRAVTEPPAEGGNPALTLVSAEGPALRLVSVPNPAPIPGVDLDSAAGVGRVRKVLPPMAGGEVLTPLMLLLRTSPGITADELWKAGGADVSRGRELGIELAPPPAGAGGRADEASAAGGGGGGAGTDAVTVTVTVLAGAGV